MQKEKVFFIGMFSNLSIFYPFLPFIKHIKSAFYNAKNTFVQDILQRHSNKKADFRMKVTLLVHVENRTKKEKKRTLPLGS